MNSITSSGVTNNITAIKSADIPKKESTLTKIADYFEPRPDTTGDLPYSSKKSAAVGGAFKGFFSTGITGAAAGMAGAVAGVAVGEETGSTTKALITGGTVGAGTMLAATSVMMSLATQAAGPGAMIGITAGAGAVAGATGVLIDKYRDSQHAKEMAEGKTPKALTPAQKTMDKVIPMAAGAITGGAIGAIGGIPTAVAGAVAGAISGTIGAELADKLEPNAGKKEIANMTILSAGIAAGTGALAGAAAAVAVSQNPAAAGMALGTTAAIGALTGTASTISASRLAATRDGSTTAFAAAALTNAFTGIGGPALSLTASIGGAIGAKQKNTLKKIAYSGATGAAMGALSGSFAGPTGVVVGGAVGAATSIAGAVAGPKVNQAIRNATADVQKFITPATSKVSEFIIDKLGTEKGLTAVGALSGAIGGLTLAAAGATIFGPIGAAVAIIGSAIMGGVKFFQIAKDISNMKQLDAKMIEFGPSISDINKMMCDNAFERIKPQLAGMSPEEQAKFYNELTASSLQELEGKKEQIDQLRKNISNAIYAQMKDSLKEIKGKNAKQEFMSSEVSKLKPELTAAMAQNIVAMIQQGEEGNPQNSSNNPKQQ